MSTTTQILFNSPALHSLKRDQLVKLCKVHSLKASGKNKELIERLQLHATTLPPNDPLDTRSDSPNAKPAPDSEDEALDSSQEGNASTPINNTRPSEQWEVVMDTITEVDEETLRSNRGTSDRQVGEFGTATSKASVTSSLRAIANSLGLKRNVSKTNGTSSSSSSLSSGEATQSSSTLPTSEPNGGSDEPVEPIPGQLNLQGLPAPSLARLSLSQEPATTTIRLVSNHTTGPQHPLSPPRLKPFPTSFDLVPATPGGDGSSSVPVWPFSPEGAARGSLYPSVPTFQGFGDLHDQQLSRSPLCDTSDMDLDVDIPGALAVPSIREPTPKKANTNAKFNTGATPKSSEKPSAEPVDIFSPAPKPYNALTRSKLGIPRSEPFVFGSPLPQHKMSNLQFRTAAQSVLDEMNKRLVEEGVDIVDAEVLDNHRSTTAEPVQAHERNDPPRVGDMFEKIHQREFDKMDSITSHYAAKRVAQAVVPQPILSKKRKSSLVVKERPAGVPAARHRPNGSRVASGASVKTLPGAFNEETDEEEEADRRLSKRPRVEREESDALGQPDKASAVPTPDPEEEAWKQKEREAIRRRLEHKKAKRRSSMGRPSLGRIHPSKPKPSRVGFFASAKSLVQNVWNRGTGSKALPNVPVSKPAQFKGETKTLPRATDTKKLAVIPGSSGVLPLSSQRRRLPSGSSNASIQPGAPGRSTLAPPVVSGETAGTATSTRVLKSPTPLSNQSSSSAAAKSSTIPGYGQSNNRGGSLVGFSSLGKKTVIATNDGRDASMGSKSSTTGSLANPQKSIPRARTTSTLMAPTASSLARMIPSRIPVATQNDNSTLTKATSKQRFAMSPQPSITLGQITNSPQNPAHSPRPAKIFSQPLSPPPTGPPMSLTAAATSIVGPSTGQKPTSPAKSPQPKVLPPRRPRISRSKVIAKLASKRAAGASPSAVGKVRSSVGAEVAGKRQSHRNARGGDMMMGAKMRVRQSEHVQRRNRVMAVDGRQKMDVD